MTDHHFITALEAIYDAALDPELWPLALTQIATCCDAAGANLFHQRDDGSYGLVVSTNFPPGAVDDYHAEWWKYDIRSHRGVAQEYTHWRGAQTDRDLLSDEEIEQSPYYSVFMRKYSLKYFMAMGVSPDPRVRVALSVQFSIERDRVTEPDLRLLERIAPHVENALRLSLKIQNSNFVSDGLQRALANLDIGVLLLDAEGRIAFANTVAMEVFGADGTVPGRAPRFGAGEGQKEAASAVRRLLDGELKDDAPRPILLSDPHGTVKAVLYVMPPGKSAGIERDFLATPGAIVLAVRPEVGAPPEPALVRDLLGITLSEARVAALVGFGASPQQAADQLGISEDTARSVLKRVFTKAGVSRQSELAFLLGKLALR